VRILVTGGTGTLGRELVPRLQAAGHTVRIMSRRAHNQDNVECATADLATGAGLSPAVAGSDVVAHLATAPYRGRYTHRVDVEGTGRLAAAARVAGTKHLVYVSIVGVDQVPWPYYRAKFAAERQVQGAGVAWSILRATQFHTLIDTALTAASRSPILPVPAQTACQPVDPGEVADRVLALIESGPDQTVSEFGGPEVINGDTLVHQWLQARGLRRRMLFIRIPGKVGAAFRAGYHLTTRQPTGEITWQQWLHRRLNRPPHPEPPP
jgi:uncharacterized protein YbjT (DUF2867 family)